MYEDPGVGLGEENGGQWKLDLSLHFKTVMKKNKS